MEPIPYSNGRMPKKEDVNIRTMSEFTAIAFFGRRIFIFTQCQRIKNSNFVFQAWNFN